MARIPTEEVRRLARLARLGLSEAEVERLAAEMGGILEHFEALRDLAPGTGDAARAEGEPPPVEGEPAARWEPAITGRARAPLRPDADGTDPLLEPPEAAAPRWRDGFFLVPRPPGLEGGG